MFKIASFKILCTDSIEILFSQILLIFFSKLGSAGLNFHLPKLSFFTDPYCAGRGAGLIDYFHCNMVTAMLRFNFSFTREIRRFR